MDVVFDKQVHNPDGLFTSLFAKLYDFLHAKLSQEYGGKYKNFFVSKQYVILKHYNFSVDKRITDVIINTINEVFETSLIN